MTESVLQDVRLAVRLLVKDRWFAAAAVAALALGIAANNAVFTLVNAVLIRDLPFDQPDRIVQVLTRTTSNTSGASYADLQDWRERTRSFEGIAGAYETTMNVADEPQAPERFAGAYISADGFRLIGHRPVLGRDFAPGDDRAGAQPVAILGHEVWRNRYQSDPGIVGRAIRVNEVASVVIGVMPEGFKFPMRAQVWQPLALMPAEARERRDGRNLTVIGRLRPYATREQGREDLQRVMADLAREYPATNANTEALVRHYSERSVGTEIRLIFLALMGAVAFVLLMACANVANLLLARSTSRIREMSVRIAIGASRWRIIRQLLVESVVLAAIAGVIGFALSIAGVRLFARAVTGTGEPYWLRFTMDPTVFAFFAAVCLGTALLFGLAPALHVSNTDVNGTLNDSGRGTAGALQARRWTGALVVVQLALAPVLLTGAGLMLRNFMAMFQVDAGIETDGLVQMRVDLTGQKYATPEQRLQFYRRLDEQLATAPGLTAALASNAPRRGAAARELSIDGRADAAPGDRPVVSLMTIGTRYFESLGQRLRQGRAFTAADGGARETVGIVNERFAALHVPGETALGRRIRLLTQGKPGLPEWVTIVGVAPDIRQRGTPDREFDAIVYVPYASTPLPSATILVRSPDPGLAASALRGHVRTIDPNLPLFDVMTLDDALAVDRWPFRVFGTMFTLFAVAAIVLAAVGLYAVTAYSVAQRTREIGVRMALGAGSREVWWLVTRRAAVQLAVGLLIGMTGALGVGRLLQGVLIRVSATDPVTLVAVPAVLVLVAVAAFAMPARRAMGLDPVAALRSD